MNGLFHVGVSILGQTYTWMVKHMHERSNIRMTLFTPSQVAIIISNQYIYLFCCRLLGSMYINQEDTKFIPYSQQFLQWTHHCWGGGEIRVSARASFSLKRGARSCHNTTQFVLFTIVCVPAQFFRIKMEGNSWTGPPSPVARLDP